MVGNKPVTKWLILKISPLFLLNFILNLLAFGLQLFFLLCQCFLLSLPVLFQFFNFFGDILVEICGQLLWINIWVVDLFAPLLFIFASFGLVILWTGFSPVHGIDHLLSLVLQLGDFTIHGAKVFLVLSKGLSWLLGRLVELWKLWLVFAEHFLKLRLFLLFDFCIFLVNVDLFG